jgi:hypothetical protein
MMMVPPGLLNLGEGLLGTRQITLLKGIGQGCKGVLRSIRLPILWRWCSLGSVGLQGREGGLGSL